PFARLPHGGTPTAERRLQLAAESLQLANRREQRRHLNEASLRLFGGLARLGRGCNDPGLHLPRRLLVLIAHLGQASEAAVERFGEPHERPRRGRELHPLLGLDPALDHVAGGFGLRSELLQLIGSERRTAATW